MESDLLKALHQNEAAKGGRMGSDYTYMSWSTLADECKAKDAEIERLKAQLSASEEKRKVLAKFYKTGERYVEARHNQDDMHNAGYFSAQAAYAQAKLDIDATSALEAP